MIKEVTRALNNKPTYMFFTVTSRCNAFCDFCWNWKNVSDAGKLHKPGQPIKRNELTLAEIEKMTLKLPNMLTVNLFGGEPFVRDDIYEIISLFIKNCDTQYISIPTNGSLTEKILTTVQKCLENFPKTFFKIYLSLDGPPLVHNKVRKLKNGYENLVRSLDGLVELRNKYPNLSVSCNSNFNAETQHAMKDFIQEIMSWKKFDSISVDLVRGELYDPKMLIVDLKLYEEIQASIKNYRPFSNQPFSPLHKAVEQKTYDVVNKALKNPNERVFDCFAGKKIFLLSDIGEVMSCEHLLDKVMGNIRDFDYDIGKLFQSANAKKLRQDIEDKKCNCRWECAINNSNICDIKKYPDLIAKTVINTLR